MSREEKQEIQLKDLLDQGNRILKTPLSEKYNRFTKLGEIGPVLTSLLITTEDGLTLGMKAAKEKDIALVEKYLIFLDQYLMYRTYNDQAFKISGKEVFSILSIQNKQDNNKTFGIYLAETDDLTLTKCYLIILKVLFQHHVFTDPLWEIEMQDKHFMTTVIHILSSKLPKGANCDGEYEWIFLPLLLYKPQITKFLIKTKNLVILNNAIDPTHPLGSFMWERRKTGLFSAEPSLKRGNLKELKDAITDLENQKSALVSVGTFSVNSGSNASKLPSFLQAFRKK